MDRETETIKGIVKKVMDAFKDRIEKSEDVRPNGYRCVVYLATLGTMHDMQKAIDAGLAGAGLGSKWITDLHYIAIRRPEYGRELEIRTNFKDGCPECQEWSILFKEVE